MTDMVIKLAFPVLWLIGMVFYVIVVVRKNKREYQEMLRYREDHVKWMVEMTKFKRGE